jgi:hypothetical protein
VSVARITKDGILCRAGLKQWLFLAYWWSYCCFTVIVFFGVVLPSVILTFLTLVSKCFATISITLALALPCSAGSFVSIWKIFSPNRSVSSLMEFFLELGLTVALI